MAVAYGADAVYLAGTSFGMRSFAGNFTPEELPEAVAYAHARGVRTHVTVNTLARNDEIVRLPAHLELLNEIGVDALIVADLGAFRLAERYAPRCERHVSTQVSVTNCVSWSGRCLLSNYMTGRDPQRGACAQPCRYRYALMEEKRPGEYFPVFEDEKGTFIMNSRDMCMIDHLDDLMDLDCLKIEGRAKSAYYAAIVTGAYRHGLDAAAAGMPIDPVWRDEVEKVSHRRYSTGFFYGEPGQYVENSRYIREYQVCAVVTGHTPDGLAKLSLRNKYSAGDILELVGPDSKPVEFTASEMLLPDGTPISEPRVPQMEFLMRLPEEAPPLSILRRSVDLSAKDD